MESADDAGICHTKDDIAMNVLTPSLTAVRLFWNPVVDTYKTLSSVDNDWSYLTLNILL